MKEFINKANLTLTGIKVRFVYSLQGAKHPGKVRNALMDFYQLVKNSGIPEFLEAIETFQNWQTEILNSFAFDLHNGFIEGVNNQTKVIKRNAFGFKSYKRFRLKILLHHQYKEYAKNVG